MNSKFTKRPISFVVSNSSNISLSTQLAQGNHNNEGITSSLDFEELLQCMICFEPFNDPKILNCAHTFCSTCLDDYHATYSSQKRAVSGKIPCPTCRELTSWPENGATGLRKDFKVGQIEELLKTMVTFKQNESTLNNCSYCNTLDKKIPAQSYCFNCEKSYCSTCLNKHSKNQLFNNHKTISISTRKNSSSDFPCRNHPSEINQFFCKSCESVACTLCLMDQHNNHDVVEIRKIIDEQLVDIKRLMGGVNEKKDELLKELNVLEPVKLQCLKSFEEAEKSITARSEIAIWEIKNKETQLLEILNKWKDSKLEHLDKEIKRIKFYITKLKGIESLLKDSTMTPSKCLKTYDLLIQRMSTMLDVDSQPDTDNILSNAAFACFKVGPREFEFGNLEFNKYGGHSLPEQRARSKTQPSIKSQPTQQLQLKSCLKRSISREFETLKLVFQITLHGAKLGELNKPLCVANMLDSNFIVSECGNKRLQIFDKQGKTVSIIAPKSLDPLGVSVTIKNNIITADTDQKRIQVFTPDGKSISKWGVGKFFNPCGTAVCPNGNFIISDVGDNSVSLYKNENSCIFRLGVSVQPDVRFNEPCYVAAGPNNEIIVSDCKNHCIKVFDSKGQFVKKIGSEGSKDGEFKYPRGICTTVEGNIIIADQNNNRITMVTRTGAFVRHLLTAENGIRSPQGISLSSKKILAITEFSPPNYSTLKVFQANF